MSAPPIPCVYDAEVGAFRILPRAHNLAAAHFGAGEYVELAPVEQRSMRSHGHQFAVIHDLWQNLPEDRAAEFVNEDHWRKRGLIETGWCTVADFACGSKAEAERWAVNLNRELEGFPVVSVAGSVVRVFRARSQSLKAMGATDFQRSKDDLLAWAARQVGVDPETLSSGRDAGGRNAPAAAA